MSKESSKKRIMEVFESLLRKKPLSRIRVEEIIRQAGVSKPTFYRYFKDKYDLACSYHVHLLSPFVEAYEKNHNYKELYLAGCKLIRDNKDVYASLFEDPFSQNSFYEFFVEDSVASIEKHIDKTSYTDTMKLELYRCIHGNVYTAWQIILGNLNMDFDKSMEYLFEIMPSFIKPILQI